MSLNTAFDLEYKSDPIVFTVSPPFPAEREILTATMVIQIFQFQTRFSKLQDPFFCIYYSDILLSQGSVRDLRTRQRYSDF